MTDDSLTPWLRQTARGRDAQLGPVGGIPAHRLERLRALAAELPPTPTPAAAQGMRLLLAVAAVICLACGALQQQFGTRRADPASHWAGSGPQALSLSPLLLTPRAETSLLEDDDIRLELVATVPAPTLSFHLPQDGGWPAVRPLQPLGGRGL
ncbi:MAG: hypothetical protein JSR82_09840 [Verrucomicrobia bacterium]|nr:hypothetical protein [Verrucomicrobiota bacterium]